MHSIPAMASIAHAPCYVAAGRPLIGRVAQSRDRAATTLLARSGGGHVSGARRAWPVAAWQRARLYRAGRAARPTWACSTRCSRRRASSSCRSGASRPVSTDQCPCPHRPPSAPLSPPHVTSETGPWACADSRASSRRRAGAASRRPTLLTLNSTQPHRPPPPRAPGRAGLAPRKQRKPEIYSSDATHRTSTSVYDYCLFRLRHTAAHCYLSCSAVFVISYECTHSKMFLHNYKNTTERHTYKTNS